MCSSYKLLRYFLGLNPAASEKKNFYQFQMVISHPRVSFLLQIESARHHSASCAFFVSFQFMPRASRLLLSAGSLRGVTPQSCDIEKPWPTCVTPSDGTPITDILGYYGEIRGTARETEHPCQMVRLRKRRLSKQKYAFLLVRTSFNYIKVAVVVINVSVRRFLLTVLTVSVYLVITIQYFERIQCKNTD